jgi:protein-tyrosine phosphatase
VAEGVFRHLVEEEGLSAQIACDSAGTVAYHSGSLPDKRMRQVAQRHGIQLDHRARQFVYDDFIQCDYLVMMDKSNFESVRRESVRVAGIYPRESQLYLYRMFDPERNGSAAVPDPYYDEIEAFEEVYQIVLRSGKQFLNWLVDQHGLSRSGHGDG